MTQTERDQQIDSLLPDNTNGGISAADLRTVTKQASHDIQLNTEDTGALAIRTAGISNGGTPSKPFTSMAHDIQLEFDQQLPADHDVALGDKRLITIGSVFKMEKTLKLYMDSHFTQPSDVEQLIREFRHTVVQAVASSTKPTQAECIEAFKKLPHFDWSKDDDFYIQDSTGSVHLFLVKYRANGATAETDTDKFVFWYEKLGKAA